MCGIVLMMSNEGITKATDRAKTFTQGVIIDTMRGHHSTGLAFVDKDGEAFTYKKPIPGHDFVDTRRYNKIVDNIKDYPYLIAHNRWATKGKVNSENAHPFQHGSITGVHNGSLFTYKDLSPGSVFDTDSEYIIKALSECTDTKDVIEAIDGAFVLVWHDSRDNTIHCVRNDDRPFHIAHLAGEDTILATSEEEMLDFMIKRNGYTTDEQYEINPGFEFIFSLDNLSKPRTREHDVADHWTKYYRNGSYNQSYSANSSSISTVTPFSSNGNKEEVYLANGIVNTFIHALVMNYVPYNEGAEFGYVECMSVEDPYDEVRIHGLKKNEYEQMPDVAVGGVVLAESLSSNGDSYVTLSPKGLIFMSTEEAYASFDDKTEKLNRDSIGNIIPIVDKDEEEKKSIASALDDGLIEEVAENDEEKKQNKRNILVLPETLWSEDGEGELCYIKDKVIHTKKEASDMLQQGCSMCGSPIPLMDFNDMEWHYGDCPICVNCQEDITFSEV